jgi:rod shape-determining protein MreD
MARALLFCVLGLIAIMIQGLLLRFGLPDVVLPQLVLVLVIYLGFNEISVLGCFIAFVLGLLLDFSSALLLGPWAGALVTVYGILAVLSSRLFIESPIVAAFIALAASITGSVMYVLLGYEYRSISWDGVGRIVGQGLCTAVLAPSILQLLARRLRKRTAPALSRSLSAQLTS